MVYSTVGTAAERKMFLESIIEEESAIIVRLKFAPLTLVSHVTGEDYRTAKRVEIDCPDPTLLQI